MIKQKIQDSKLQAHLKSLPEDRIETFLLADDKIRLSAVSATTMVNEMRANHLTGVVETLVLGQAYIAGALLSTELKGNDRIQLFVECGGPIGEYHIESWAGGAVRGYLKNNPIQLDKPLKSADLSPLYGPGFLTVTRFPEGSKEPFSGQVMLQYGSLAKDLAVYYQESQQTPTVFDLSVKFDTHGRVMGAGGFFIQVMPGCPDELLEEMEKYIQTIPSLGKYLESGNSIKNYVLDSFNKFKPKSLGGHLTGFSCPCNLKNYTIFLSKLPKDEKEAIIKENKFPLEVECFNCGTRYRYSKEQIEKIFEEGNK